MQPEPWANNRTRSRAGLLRALERHPVGQRVPIEIWQDDATRTIEVRLEELPR
jgi:hypothetical protein